MLNGCIGSTLQLDKSFIELLEQDCSHMRTALL